MDINRLLVNIEMQTSVKKLVWILLMFSIAANLLLAGLAFRQAGRAEKTFLIPPEIHKSFWVDGQNLDPNYLEVMGVWAIQLRATVSPYSVDYQNSLILQHAHPSDTGALSVELQRAANQIKKENLSLIFHPREVRIDKEAQAIALIGFQTRWVAEKRIGDEMKAYLASFRYENGMITIKELRETNMRTPFEKTANPAGSESVDEDVETDVAGQIDDMPSAPISNPDTAVDALRSGQTPDPDPSVRSQKKCTVCVLRG
jgi:conjugal transfer pilus assembly protein TraE